MFVIGKVFLLALMVKQITPLLLCGGVGARLYPLSQHNCPKQFLNLIHQDTSLQAAAKRFGDSGIFTAPIIIANSTQLTNVIAQLNDVDIKPAAIISEPFGKNTAAAIICGSIAAIQEFGENAVVVSSPSDQVWYDTNDLLESIVCLAKIFTNQVNIIEDQASVLDSIITFGIKPSNPSSQFGYIKLHSIRNRDDRIQFRRVETFIEKPSIEFALEYIESDNYFWNSGIYMGSANTILHEATKNCCELYKHCEISMHNAEYYTIQKNNDANNLESQLADVSPHNNTQQHSDIHITNLRPDDFSHVANASIEEAIITKNKNILCMEIKTTDWNDIGSWEGLLNAAAKYQPLRDIVSINAENSYIYSNNKKVIAIGVRDLIALNLDDHLLLLNSQQIEQIRINLPEIIANIESDT